MRRPNTKLCVHCVWSTADRLPLIQEAVEPQIVSAIAAKCVELKSTVIAIGGTRDHIHVLVAYPAALSVAKLVKEMKGASSHLMNHVIAPDEFFKWQGAYGAFTVSTDRVETVALYIRSQKQRHSKGHLDPEIEPGE